MNEFCTTLFFVFSIAINSYCDKGDSRRLSIKIRLVKEYFVPYNRSINYIPANDSINEKRFDIQVSLKNNSDSTIYIWLKSCSWEENFLINNTYIFFAGKDCDGNYPRTVRIKAKDSLTLNMTLTRTIMWDNPCKYCIGQLSEVTTTKIGLIYIDKMHCNGFWEYRKIIGDKSRWDDIIWSNSLYLNK
jgi:hypothetical protein